MCAYIKGTRKRKPSVIRDLRIGGFEIPFGAVVIALFAVLYLVILVGRNLEAGTDALILQIASFGIFAFFAYAVRKKVLRLDPYVKIIDIFLGLSTIPLVFDLAKFFNVYDLSVTGISGLAVYNTINLLISAVIVALILYNEKDRLEDIYVRAGNVTSGLAVGIVGLAAFVILAAIGGYFANDIKITDWTTGTTPIMIFAFCTAGALAEELWFRGMLLSRIREILEKGPSNYIQAAIFAVFETIVVYVFIASNVLLVPVVFLASAILGYFWGRMTIKNESILGPVLFHTGFYLFMVIRLFF